MVAAIQAQILVKVITRITKVGQITPVTPVAPTPVLLETEAIEEVRNFPWTQLTNLL